MKNFNLNKGILRGIFVLIILFSFGVNAQSLTGTRGLIKAPTARMYESGTLAIGMGYVPAKFFKRTYNNPINNEFFKGYHTGNAGLNTFVTVNTLPFIEIMFRYSHELNMKVTPNTQYFPDRMFTVRIKIINERKHFPSIVIGLQDLSGILKLTSNTANNFNSLYIVGSKNFSKNNLIIDASIGYGFNNNKIFSKEFIGLFGGFEIKHKDYEQIQLLFDYDTESYNIGIQSKLFERLHSVIGLMDFKPMFILAYTYKI